MAEFIRRHSLLIASLVLLIFSFQLMSFSVQNQAFPQLGGRMMNAILSPVEKLSHDFTESGNYLWRRYLYLLDVETERNELLSRVKALESQNSRMVETESENGRLRQLLQFPQEAGIERIAANVISRDASNWTKTITIDRGAADGIRPGFCVVDGEAIIGQTTVVTDHSSRVLLLTDNTSAIDAIVQNNRVSGIAEGTLDQRLRLRYVVKDYTVQPGDRVIASGLDGVFLKGTLIGVVTAVRANTSGLFQDIELQPSVDLRRLETVLVLKPTAAPAPVAAAAKPTSVQAAPAVAPTEAASSGARETPSAGIGAEERPEGD